MLLFTNMVIISKIFKVYEYKLVSVKSISDEDSGDILYHSGANDAQYVNDKCYNFDVGKTDDVNEFSKPPEEISNSTEDVVRESTSTSNEKPDKSDIADKHCTNSVKRKIDIVSAIFKLTSRYIRADDVEECNQKWFFKTIDLKCMSATESGCDNLLSNYVIRVEDQRDKSKHGNSKKGVKYEDLGVRLDNLMSSISVSVTNGLICLQWGRSSNDEQGNHKYCVSLNSSLVKAWLTLSTTPDSNICSSKNKRLLCVQELNLLSMSTFSPNNHVEVPDNHQKSIRSPHATSPDCAFMEDDTITLKQPGDGDTTTPEWKNSANEQKRYRFDSPNFLGRDTTSSMVYIGKTGKVGSHQMYLLVSDNDMRFMVNRARQNVLNFAFTDKSSKSLITANPLLLPLTNSYQWENGNIDSSVGRGKINSRCGDDKIITEEILLSALYYTHQNQAASTPKSKDKQLAVVLYDPALVELKKHGLKSIPICCAVDVYIGGHDGLIVHNNDEHTESLTTSILRDRLSYESEFVRYHDRLLMQLSFFDKLYISCAGIICALASVSCILSPEIRVFLCGTFPIDQLTNLLDKYVEVIIYYICLIFISIWSRKSIPSCQTEFIKYIETIDSSQFNHEKISVHRELQRWIYTKFVVSLFVDFSSRYENEYTHVRCLGMGGFGVVFEAVNRLDTRRVAVKRIMFTSEPRKEILQEIRFLALIDHPNVVYYHCGWFEVPPMGWQRKRDKILVEPYITKDEFSSQVNDSIDTRDSISQSGTSTINCVQSCDGFKSSSVETSLFNDSLHTYDTSQRNTLTHQTVKTSANNEDSFKVIFDRSDLIDECSTSSNSISSFDTDDDDCSGQKQHDSEENSSNSGNEYAKDDDESSGINKITRSTVSDKHVTVIRQCKRKDPLIDNDMVILSESDFRETDTSGVYTRSTGSPISARKSETNSGDEYVFTRHSDDEEGAEHLRIVLRERNAARRRFDACFDVGKNINKDCPGYLYFCMELCRPDTLREWLETHNTTQIRPMSDSMWYFIQICKGVRYLHSCELVHRDLKPSNILFSRYDNSSVKIGDFGLMVQLATTCNADVDGERVISRNCQSPDASLGVSSNNNTKNGNRLDVNAGIVGTELYISPEQFECSNLPLNKSIDMYSLGIILFELMYAFSTNMERVMMLRCLRSHCSSQLSSHQSITNKLLREHVSRGFTPREIRALDLFIENNALEWTIIRWLLSKEPADRPSAAELLNSRPLIEMAYKHLDAKRFSKSGWERARCTSFSQTTPI